MGTDSEPAKPRQRIVFKDGKTNTGIARNFAEKYENPKKWYEEVADDPTEFEPVTEEVLMNLQDEAKKCYDSEVVNYSIRNTKTNPDYQWMKTVMSKGTISDKVAAYTVLIQDDPVHNLSTIRNIVGLVKVGKKNECTSVIDTLTDLFLNDLLKPQKLKKFDSRPLSQLFELSSGNATSRRKYLSSWHFEDQLKETYHTFVVSLNSIAHDSVEATKEKAIGAMYKLLAGNSEEEKNLLIYIVNKLGDPSKKVASKAIYCLSQLLFQHPNMQGVVLTEVEKLLFRSNISVRTQYYGLCFLSRYHLSKDAADVAKKLIEVYFSFFRACVKKGDVDTRMMSALLIGVNRAYPYAKLEMEKISEHIDTIYRVVHVANFNVSLHALSLLYQVSDCANNINDRFYSALYKKLNDPEMSVSTHHAILLSLVFRALKKDTDIGRIKAFIKRLLQLSLYMQPPFVCGVLFLISQLIRKNTKLNAFVSNESVTQKLENEMDEEDGDDQDGEKYADVKDEEADDESEKEKVEERTSALPGNSNSVAKSRKSSDASANNNNAAAQKATAPPGWFHFNTAPKPKTAPCAYDSETYNGFQRNPKYAGGANCCYVELDLLQTHFHPTVSLFASKLLQGESVMYTGDPLKDFMLIKFLDRFAFKNPKKPSELSEEAATNSTFGKRKSYKATGVRSLPVNSSNYLNNEEKRIPVDELFLYKYLRKQREGRAAEDGDDDDGEESDADSVASEEFEEMLSKMAGMPKGGAQDDSDEEIDYMTEIGETMKKSKSSKKKHTEGSDDGDDDDEEEGEEYEEEEAADGENDFGDEDIDDLDENEVGFDDLEMNEGDKEMLDDLDDDDDASDIDFNSDAEGDGDDEDDDDAGDDVFLEGAKSKKKGAKGSGGGAANSKKKGKKNFDSDSLFASAEEFASILDEEGASAIAPGGSNAFQNKDKADLKQISWEDKRNRWLQGYDRALGNKKKSTNSTFKGSKNFTKKRKFNNSKPNSKNKKSRY